MENPLNLKRSTLKSLIVHALCKGIKKFPQSSEAAKTALIQNLLYFDHTVDLLCDYLSTLVLEYDSTILLDQVLVEIGNMSFSSEAGIKSIGRFLGKLALLQPKEVLKNISALIGHLDCEVCNLIRKER
jgi:hypothetical protein